MLKTCYFQTYKPACSEMVFICEASAENLPLLRPQSLTEICHTDGEHCRRLRNELDKCQEMQ